MTQPIAPKICTKSDSYVPHLSSKFQVSTFSRFKVIAFLTSGCRIRNFAQKKHRDFQRQASRKSQKGLFPDLSEILFPNLIEGLKKEVSAIWCHQKLNLGI